ncbi:nuclear transport factor 2 family protein [Luteimonas vadosa]|uniref:DUF4440 domain-containing protein n=1 Tax=Luteimonas vadosa TaxID=1165507 RepID=A0ABP9DVA4_9GAMM
MKSCLLAFGTVILLSVLPLSASSQEATGESRERLIATERESHQQWLRADLAALDALMAPDFHFVVMNGAVESKADVVGSDLPPEDILRTRPLQVASLRVEPEKVFVRGETAIVISLLHIEATVRERPIPERMRILSVYSRTQEDPEWRLTARSITPIQVRPAGAKASPAPPGE